MRPPTVPIMQNVGVLLFFVMSGFLITATIAQNSIAPGYTFKSYFIDRFARIYSGLLPALLFIIVVDGITIYLTGDHTIARYYNLKTLLANLVMLEGYRGALSRIFQWSAFGSASPLWTLAIEWHIYMFVGAAFFIFKGRGRILFLLPVLVFFGQTALHFLIGAFQPDGVGSALFALWLGGAAIYLVLSRYVPPLLASVPALAVSLISYFLMVTPGREYDLATYPALVLIVGSLIAISQRTRAFGSASLVRTAANFSFTLYLIHHTIMMGVQAIFPSAQGWLWFFVVVLLCNLAAYLIARPFEMKHKQFARWIGRWSDHLWFNKPAPVTSSRPELSGDRAADVRRPAE